MSKSDQAKNAGKFIIIMLCFAILFFLLLPFLEDPSAVGAAQSKKATPQIFTSNPLTELARKVYALFSTHSKKTHRTDGTRNRWPAAEVSPHVQETFVSAELLPDEVLYSVRRNDENAAQNNGADTAVYFPEGYDYAEAEFVNEDGQWVLVRQTAPDAAQRGMHDINTSDTPYDRLIRRERAAKYGAEPARQTQTIPSSKWARLFQPINRFLGLPESDSPNERSGQDGFALAAATDGLGQGNERRPNERFARRPDLDMNAPAPNIHIPVLQPAAASGDWSLLDVLDPTQAFERLRSSVDRWYGRRNGEDTSQTNKNRREEALEMIRQQQLQFRQENLSQIQQDAANQQPASMLDTFSSCYGATLSYQAQQPPATDEQTQEEESCPPPPDRNQQMQQAQEQGKLSLQQLEKALGFTPPPMNVVIVMGKEQPIFNINEEEYKQTPEEAFTKEFYNYLSTQNCPDGNCYWVAASDEADALAVALGGKLYSDPLNVMSEQLPAFKQAKLQQAQQSGMGEEELQQLTAQLDMLQPHYIAYNAQQWQALQTPPRAQGENRVKPSLFITPTAANAQTFAPDTRMPSAIFYDTNGQVLNGDSDLSPAQQGALLTPQIVRRIETMKQEMQELEQTLAQMQLDGTLGDQMEQTRRQLEQRKQEWEQMRNMSAQISR